MITGSTIFVGIIEQSVIKIVVGLIKIVVTEAYEQRQPKKQNKKKIKKTTKKTRKKTFGKSNKIEKTSQKKK